MPRRNNQRKLPKPAPFHFVVAENTKTRYKNKHEAEQAAEIAMLQKPGLVLDVYESNGGWYLTSRTSSS